MPAPANPKQCGSWQQEADCKLTLEEYVAELVAAVTRYVKFQGYLLTKPVHAEEFAEGFLEPIS